MKYDKPLIAVLFGMALIIPLELYTLFFKYLGLTKVSAFEYTSMLMVMKPSWLIGLMTGPGVGGLAGLVVYYSTKLFGTDYLPLKGAGIGAVTYGLIDVIMGIIADNPEFKQLLSGHFVHASAGALGGMLAGLLIKKYLLQGEKGLNKKEMRRYIIAPQPSFKKKNNPILSTEGNTIKRTISYVKPKKL